MNKSFVEWLDYYENATKEDVIQDMMLDINSIKEKNNEIERLNNIINRTTKYVQSLSSKGRGCDIYEDIKQEILKELIGSDKE